MKIIKKFKALLLVFSTICCTCCACSSPPQPPMPVGPKVAINKINNSLNSTLLVQDFVNDEMPVNKNEFNKVTNYRK